ncbi:flagellin [Poseidonocella sedimentorum]|uniref:Flagellin n=1 Tax=Poseidonocella sedimentorum TaxID=871652 RepID=A0A1I6D5A0_9RHOB|nr:flagellin [Poseidonocella sedimentorum]SFR00625.1 flagellin [Poseidonocella sedimentorum]
MSSILTNNSAMVALQTLKSINSDLNKTQEVISTGKEVGSAKDNSAVWAISKVMESDVAGFEAISDSLSLGQSTVAVARNAAETVEGLLEEVKTKIVASQEENVDRDKIQTDIEALRDQITSVVGAAQFNGLNMLSNTDETAGSGTVSIMSSLDRGADGSITAADIDVRKQDLSTQAQSVDTGGTRTAGTGAMSVTLNASQSLTIDLSSETITAGVAYSIGLTGTDADASAFTPASYTTAATATGAANIAYVARDGDTGADVADALAAAYTEYAAENSLDTDVLNITSSGGVLTATSTVTDGTDTIGVTVDTVAGDNVIGGGLAALADIDVTDSDGAEAALASIENLIQSSIDSAAALGSAEKRVGIQNDFVGKLTDSLKSGIGSLVDADMEETSARLQALQVQQQLGVQSLSIANQAPQTILSLFR